MRHATLDVVVQESKFNAQQLNFGRVSFPDDDVIAAKRQEAELAANIRAMELEAKALLIKERAEAAEEAARKKEQDRLDLAEYVERGYDTTTL